MASWYGCDDLSNASLFEEIAERRLFMLSGMLLIMVGGWLLFIFTYSGLLLGFMNGLNVPDFRSIVMSKKSIVFKFASIVILRLFCLKILHISFLMFSICLGVFVVVASPSSRYSPTFMSKVCSWERRYSPTSSHVSAPS